MGFNMDKHGKINKKRFQWCRCELGFALFARRLTLTEHLSSITELTCPANQGIFTEGWGERVVVQS